MEGFPYPITVEENGNSEFALSVLGVLTILRDILPHRYQEAITYLPHVQYDPNLKSWGRSDGSFSLQGFPKYTKRKYMGEEETEEEHKKAMKDFERFQWVYLHEVGHNICIKQNGDRSEKAANAYADMVMQELRKKGEG